MLHTGQGKPEKTGLAGFPTQSVSAGSQPFCPVPFPYGCQSRLSDKVSIKGPRVQRASRELKPWRFLEVVYLGRAWKLCVPFPVFVKGPLYKVHTLGFKDCERSPGPGQHTHQWVPAPPRVLKASPLRAALSTARQAHLLSAAACAIPGGSGRSWLQRRPGAPPPLASPLGWAEARGSGDRTLGRSLPPPGTFPGAHLCSILWGKQSLSALCTHFLVPGKRLDWKRWQTWFLLKNPHNSIWASSA